MNEYSRILVLIPFRNEENYIQRCLASVANQNFKNFLVLMSDNCSTDASNRIAEVFTQKDPRFKLFKHAEPKSVSVNWNTLISKLNDYDSDYVMWLSADDYIVDENYLQNMMTVADNQRETHCFIPKFMNVSQDGDVNMNHSFEITFDHKVKFVRHLRLATNWANCVSLYGMYRRKTFEFLAKSESSMIKDAPESDWWWTFALAEKFSASSVPTAIYIKTIKETPYYRELKPQKSKKFARKLSNLNVTPLKIVLSAKSRGLNWHETGVVILLSVVILFHLSMRKISGKVWTRSGR